MDTEAVEAYPPWRQSVIQLLLIAAAIAASSFGGAVLSPLIEPVRIGLHLTDNQIAIAQGAAIALPTLAVSLPLGLYIDRGQRARLLQCLVLLAGLGAMATSLVVGPNSFIASRTVFGVVSAGAYPVAMSLVGDLFAPAWRGRASMLLSVGATLGTAGAYAIGGAASDMFAGHTQGWRLAMAVMGAPLVAFAVVLFMVREPKRRNVSADRFSVRRLLPEVWAHRAVLAPLTVAMTTVSMADMASIVWTAPLMRRAFGLDVGHIGAMISVALLVTGLATPVLTGMLSDKIYKHAAVAGVIIFTTCITLLTIPASFYPVFGAPGTFTLGFGVFVSGGIAVHIEIALLFVLLVPNELRGLFISACSAASTLFSLGVAPLAVTLLASHLTGALPLATALAWVMVSMSLVSAAATGWMYLSHRSGDGGILRLGYS